MAVLSPDLGPLPRSDRADELQQLSLTAFRAEVPQERFLLRDERTDDKGVDLSLELKVEGSFTNIRSQVQLKATDRQDLNPDGTFSLQVDVSNLNYLLSGTSPMYVLWIAPRKELRYTWARDEARRLYGENPEWGDQRTVTLRFLKKLTPDEWENVYDHIFREGQLHRKTHDSLAKVATSERVVVAIDADSMKVTDSESAYRLLSESGLAIIAAGYANLALAQAKLLRDSQSGEPRIHLVCGYAALTMGNYFTARGHLGQALAGRNGLSALNRYFLDALVLVCDYHLGRLAQSEYKEMQLRLETEAPRLIASQLHLDRIIHEQLSESNDARRSELTIELRELVEQIQADASLPESVKLGARIALLHAEGRESSIVRLHAITRLQMRAGMGLNPFTPAKLASITRLDEMDGSVYHEASECIREAVRLRNPLLIAEAFCHSRGGLHPQLCAISVHSSWSRATFAEGARTGLP